MKQVRAVAVYLYAGLRFRLAVGVPADVLAAVDDQDAQAQVVSTSLRDGEPEEAGADDHEVDVHERAGVVGSSQAAGRSAYSQPCAYSCAASGCVIIASSWSRCSVQRLTIGRYTARRHHHGISR